MNQRQVGGNTAVWLGKEPGRPEAFGEGKLWIGQHAADHDILVFDPSEADPHAEVLALYSLTQHRMRSFPRATVLARISALTDELGRARAKKDYGQRATLRSMHEQALAAERTERLDRQRGGVRAAHQRYIEALGLEYQGARETPQDHRAGRRKKCHVCAIVLDNFTGTVCVICDGILCSCGACACRKADTKSE